MSAEREHERKFGGGYAFPDNAGLIVDLPNLQSRSSVLSWRTSWRYVLGGAAIFAVEVRSLQDYGQVAELRMAAKRKDYFAAGVVVVWDVDVRREKLIRVFRSSDPASPTVYHEGELAEAEPAVPGWHFAVSEMFD